MSYQKKRQGGYYNQKNYKKKRNFVLEPGIKGFLCTCNSREKDCVREAYNILNDYADRLYEKEASSSAKDTQSEETTVPEEENVEEEDDIDTALSKEISNLKQGYNKQWRFQVVESGANNCVFIKTMLADPTELAHYIMKDIQDTKKQRSRFLLRLIPVEVTCKAYMDDMKKNAALLFDKYFSKEGKTFAIAFNHRNNNSISRVDIIEEFAEMIKFRHVDNKVDLSQPQLTIIIEVVRSMCCMSVVPDYFKLLKYNLLELCGKGEKAAIEAKKAEKAKAEGDACVTKDENPSKTEVCNSEGTSYEIDEKISETVSKEPETLSSKRESTDKDKNESLTPSENKEEKEVREQDTNSKEEGPKDDHTNGN